MADEMTNTEPVVDSNDPLQSLLESHMARMQEISTESFNKSKELTDDLVFNVRRQAGVKSAILDKALENLGLDREGIDEYRQV